MSQGRRGELRWLLRLLGAPLVVEALFTEPAPQPPQPWPITLVGALEALPATNEHREAERQGARTCLEGWLGDQPSLPMAYLQLIVSLQGLGGDDRGALLDLSHYEGLPQLFEAPGSLRPGAEGFHETHVHFRGSVPYATLWAAWRRSPRLRGTLKTPKHCVLQGRSAGTTWGERLDCVFGMPAPSWCRHSMGAVPLETVVCLLSCTLRVEVLAIARYLAVCIGLRNTLIHQRNTAGLDRFVRSYMRYSKAQKRRRALMSRPGSDGALLHGILDRMAEDGVASIELRPTLDKRRADSAQKLRRLVNAHRDWQERAPKKLALGLVPSLLKTEGFGNGALTVEDQQQIWCNQTEALLSLLEGDPLLRHHVVGLDAAGSEQGLPPRLFAPAFQMVHQYNRRHGVYGQRPGRTVSPSPKYVLSESVPFVRIGLTMHAGEDFSDPITGLRHIWEALQALDLQPGDRLGHALAAGLDGDLSEGMLCQMLHRRAQNPRMGTTRIVGRAIRVAKPTGAHVLDLAWQIERLPEHRSALSPRFANALSRTYGEHTHAVRMSTQAAALDGALRLPIPVAHFESAEALEPEARLWVELDAFWMTRFNLLRHQVRTEIRRRQVVVESCPTSNIAVANLPGHLVDAFDRAGIRVVIATDDPGVFGVYPAGELARLDSPAGMVDRSRQASFMRVQLDRGAGRGRRACAPTR